MKSLPHKPDLILLTTALVLTIFGLLMVYDASIAKAYTEFEDQYYFVRNQAIGIIAGIITAYVTYRIDYNFWKRVAFPGLIFGLILLIAVFIPGLSVTAYGSQRWLNLGFTLIQPSELMKLFYVIYLSSMFSIKKDTLRSFLYTFLPFLVVTGLIFILIVVQPDLGTAIQILGNGILLYFIAGASLIHMGIVFPLVGAFGMLLIWIAPYRRARLLTFLNPSSDLLGSSYHINQILIALGSGGIFGLGFGASRQKYQYLPEVMTDSIFAVIGEELGYIGVLLVIAAFSVFIWRGLKISREAPDIFSRLLAVGITGWIGIQALINLGAMASLLPLTGVPLPFISYGRSSIVTILVGVGILLHISSCSVREDRQNGDRRKRGSIS